MMHCKPFIIDSVMYVWVIDQVRGQYGWILAKFFLNRRAVGWAVSCSAFGLFLFFCSFVGDYIQTSADDVPRMMSSSANYRPFLSSFRHIPPQESFVKLAN